MVKIEAPTLEDAYKNAASALHCSVTQLKIEVVQYPKKGVMGLFKRNAIVVAIKDETLNKDLESENSTSTEEKKDDTIFNEVKSKIENIPKKFKAIQPIQRVKESFQNRVHLKQLEEEKTPLKEKKIEIVTQENEALKVITQHAQNVKKEINELFNMACFNIETIEVDVYNENTLLINIKGKDAALLIGKEGYRYKAISYMLFNWISAKYKVGIRLEIAEFLKNQEEAIKSYLKSVYEIIDSQGRAQTKILDGVLVQIALNELRERYPKKYVVIRTNRDGLKYILVNDYHS